MTTSLLSPKYQIVIPKKIREAIGLRPGQRIKITEKNGKIELTPILTTDEFIGSLKGKVHKEFKREKVDRILP